jgi:hypothetical protein
MTFEDFLKYLKSNLMTPVKFDTLAGRSYFHAIFHAATSSLEIKNKSGSVGILDKNSLNSIYQRYSNAPLNRKNMTSYYAIDNWPNSPNKIFAPYVPAIIKSCLEEN